MGYLMKLKLAQEALLVQLAKYYTTRGTVDFNISENSKWTKYFAHPKIRRPKPCLLMFVSLVDFHLLLFTQLTTDLIPELSGRSMFHPLVHIYAKTPFCCVETVANYALNRRCVVVFDRLWAIAAPTLNTAFSLTNFHANDEYTAFRYLQLLCYLIQLEFTIGQNKFVGSFCVLPGQLPHLGDLRVQYHLCLYDRVWSQLIIS